LEESAANSMPPHPSLLRLLARSLISGEQDLASGVAKRYISQFQGKTRPTRSEVEQFLLIDPAFRRTNRESGAPASSIVRIDRWLSEPDLMLPVPAARNWNLPEVCSVGELSEWLRLTQSELDWFADLKQLCRNSHSLQHHYHYTVAMKRNGGIRLIESPKERLKLIQRQILSAIFDRIPSHHAAHGFVKGRSIRTFTALHAGKGVVLRMDLQDFFPSIGFARVAAIFRTCGYPDRVAAYLAGLCTNSVPATVWQAHESERNEGLSGLYSMRHLPQGAPTSPALGNAAAYRLDCRLEGLALSAGANYTRYADDLAFSGEEAFERGVNRFKDRVAAIILEEGFAAHHRKTRIMCQSTRQRLAGLIVNQHLNIAREEFDGLKAILTNCIRAGVEGQNRSGHRDFRSHLSGRIAFIEYTNPGRGAKLRALFEQIKW
jgi:hypothetical protein